MELLILAMNLNELLMRIYSIISFMTTIVYQDIQGHILETKY